MIKKIKNLRFLLILVGIVFLLVAWLEFELMFNDVKGEENVVKKIYYQVARIIPVKPAIKLAVSHHHQEHAYLVKLPPY